MNRVLIIDHDPASCEMLMKCLYSEGFVVIVISDAEEGLQFAMMPDAGLDLILLSSIDALGALQRIRSTLDTPVILLAEPNQQTLHVKGLNLGADDFLVKPCDSGELRARARAVLRRTRDCSRHTPEIIVRGDIELNCRSRTVGRNGERLLLTFAEFNILEILMKATGQIVTRENLAQGALGRSQGASDRSVDMHVSHIRKKLGHHPNGDERIITVRGVGFMYAQCQ